jgi:Flp pilus assembly pilin Flp
MLLKKKNKGQSALEYTVLLIVLIAAFLTTQNYVKRGIQGRWKESVDQLGDQYDPRTADTNIRQTMVSNTNTEILAVNIDGGFWTMRRDDTISVENRTGQTSVGAY